jgi:hypothetical protein
MRLILILISAALFIFYGLLILLTNHMKFEFKRYDLEKFRTLTGYLELAGGIGQLIGLFYPILLILSSIGLSLLMFLGTIVRLRVRDPWIDLIPAIFLMLLNISIFFMHRL